MPDATVVPIFACPVGEVYGHHCARPRGHRGGHECRCGMQFSATPTNRIPHHSITTINWPEANAA